MLLPYSMWHTYIIVYFFSHFIQKKIAADRPKRFIPLSWPLGLFFFCIKLLYLGSVAQIHRQKQNIRIRRKELSFIHLERTYAVVSMREVAPATSNIIRVKCYDLQKSDWWKIIVLWNTDWMHMVDLVLNFVLTRFHFSFDDCKICEVAECKGNEWVVSYL